MCSKPKKERLKPSKKHTSNEPYVAPPCDSLAAQKHVPVLYSQVLSFVEPTENMCLLDGTLGMAGHAEGMLQTLQQAGITNFTLLGLDRDLDALALASERLAVFGSHVITRHSCFADFTSELAAVTPLGAEFAGFDFALIDIGVSSMQIDTPDRGFSFVSDGPLDMRMDTSCGNSAAHYVNKLPVAKLKEIIEEYGEEPMAGRIARAIDDARANGPIETTAELARIVEAAYPAKWRATSRKHPATRTFQALRMLVNDELGQLQKFLEDIVPLMKTGGRIAVITFHSLEDRIVKHFFRDQATGCKCPKHIPICVCGNLPKVQILTRKAICASDAEVAVNSRASSAKLRVVEKMSHGNG